MNLATNRQLCRRTPHQNIRIHFDKTHILMTNNPGYTRGSGIGSVVWCGAVAVVVEWCGAMWCGRCVI